MDLGRLVDLGHPARRVTYDLAEVGSPTLADVLAPYLDKWRRREPAAPMRAGTPALGVPALDGPGGPVSRTGTSPGSPGILVEQKEDAMTDPHATLAELAERLEALGLKLKLHLAQGKDDGVPEALGRLRQGVEDAFEAAGYAVRDEAVRADVRDVGRLFADAVTASLAKVGDDLRELANRT
jgi:hypothetical protein